MNRDLSGYHKDDRETVEQVLAIAESEDFCLKGWGDEQRNKDGCCCCNCVYQFPINGHPWNRHDLVRTPVTHIVGWGCMAPDLMPFITFFDRSHGMCEMYSRKTYGHQKTAVAEL